MSRLRSLFFSLPAIVFGAIFLGSLESATWCFARSAKWQYRLSRCWCRMVLASGFIRIRVKGLEKIDPAGQYVFVANHSSYLDTPALLAHLPGDVRFFAYKGLFDIPFFGSHMKRAGHLPVDSSSPRASFLSMAQGARLIGELGVSVVLFPEGSRSPQGLREFREGAAYIAIKAGVPAVPIGIVGMRELMPVGSLHIRSGSVEIRIGDPIPTSGLDIGDRVALTRRLHAEVAHLINGVSPQDDFPGVDEGADREAMVQSRGREGHGMKRP